MSNIEVYFTKAIKVDQILQNWCKLRLLAPYFILINEFAKTSVMEFFFFDFCLSFCFLFFISAKSEKWN